MGTRRTVPLVTKKDIKAITAEIVSEETLGKDESEVIDAFDADAVAAALTAGKNKDGEEIFDADMIDGDSIRFIQRAEVKDGDDVVKVTGTVIFELKEIYGGGDYSFDGVVIKAEATTPEP